MGIMLISRGLLGLVFGAYLAMSVEASWESFFVILSNYLIADGLLGAAIGAAMLRESAATQRTRELTLSTVVLIDAAGRTLSGVAIRLWPGIPGFPVTAVVFVGVMAICTTAVGLMEAWLTVREEVARHGRGHQTPQFMAGPVGVASLVSTAFGVAAVLSIESQSVMRLLIGCFVAAAGTVALAMAWSHRRMARRRAAAPSATTV